MKKINVKRIRRQCFIPGCGCLDSYMVQRTREPYPKVVICKKCAEELYFALFPKEETAEEQNVKEAEDGIPEPDVKVDEVKPAPKPRETAQKKTSTATKTTARKAAK